MLKTTDAQAKGVVDGAHPLRVALGQIVVDGDEVRAVALEGVQVKRQRGDESFALAGLHLRYLALMQDDAADELDIEVAHGDASPRSFAHDGEGFRQDVVHAFAVREALAELVRLGAQLGVSQGLDGRLEVVDPADKRAHFLDCALVAVPEYAKHGFFSFCQPSVWNSAPTDCPV